jgi:tRNA threonylcarbamoyl adenosine modification protein YeaZ
MIVAGLDCSGEDLLLGLAVDQRVIGTRRVSAQRRHAELLPGEFITFIQLYGYSPAEIDGYAVISGPGSYTGLRVGAACVMGLATPANLPVATLTSFEFLSREYADPDKPLGILIPCRGNLYYWRMFAAQQSAAPPVEIRTAEEIAAMISGAMRIVGPHLQELEKASVQRGSDIEFHQSPASSAGGRLALWGEEKIAAGDIIDRRDWRLDYGPTPGFRKWSKPTH